MKIPTPVQEITDALKDLQKSYKILDTSAAAVLRKCVESKFAMREGTVLWHRLGAHRSIYDPNGWMCLDEFLASEPFVLFFDKDDDHSMVEVPPSTSLKSVLGECTGFEFYVTNDRASYLICFNDHDVLIGAGDAEAWSVFAENESE